MTFDSVTQRMSALTGSRTGQRIARFAHTGLPVLAVLVLILAVSHQLAGLTWSLVYRPSAHAMEAAASSGRSAPARGPAAAAASDYQQLARLHLFGRVEQTPEPHRQAPIEAPETTLNLTLHGIFVYSGSRDGAAIIGKRGGEQAYYRTGQKVYGGAELVEVRSDHVLLLRNGQYETLRFPETEQLTLTQPTATPSSNAAEVDLGNFRDMLVEEPQKVLDYVRVLPVKVRGELKGYRLLPQRDRELYDSLGLQPTDIVTAVNGIPVTNASRMGRVFNEFKSADRLVVQLQRGGSSQTVTINLR